jgi:hypothetical protein
VNFTRENRGAHAVLKVLGEGAGRQVATEDRPFDGISADAKDGENTVWIAFGSTPDDLFTHGVHGATRSACARRRWIPGQPSK